MTALHHSPDEVSVPSFILPAKVATKDEALSLIQSLRSHFGLEEGLPSTPLADDQVYVIIATTARGHLMRETTVRSPEYVPAEVARSKDEPGVEKVRVGIRTGSVDGELRLV